MHEVRPAPMSASGAVAFRGSPSSENARTRGRVAGTSGFVLRLVVYRTPVTVESNTLK